MQTNKLNDQKIYETFLKIKSKESKMTVVELAKKNRISRQRVYQIVQEMEKGTDTKLDKCLMSGRLDCLWRHRYQKQFSVVSKLKRTVEGKEKLKIIVLDMLVDGFNFTSISKYTKLDREFISNLIKK